MVCFFRYKALGEELAAGGRIDDVQAMFRHRECAAAVAAENILFPAVGCSWRRPLTLLPSRGALHEIVLPAFLELLKLKAFLAGVAACVQTMQLAPTRPLFSWVFFSLRGHVSALAARLPGERANA